MEIQASHPLAPKALSQWFERHQTHCLALITVVLACVFGLAMMPEHAHYHDESFHVPQIERYMQGIYQGVEASLTMIPGYHALVALSASIFFDQSPDAIRTASFVMSIPALLFFFLSARELGHRQPSISSLIFFLCPIIFPFFFVIYTDIPSLAFVLAGLYCTLKRQYSLAALVMCLSMLLRQTNVVWLALFWLFALLDHGAWGQLVRLDFRALLKNIAKTWGFLGGCVLFVTFVVINGGVALGDASAHAVERLYLTQVFFCLFAVFFLFMPWHIANTRRIFALVKARPQLLFLLSLVFAVYITTFWADHGYNYFDFFLRNQVVMWVRQNFWTQTLAFIPMAWAFLSLCVTPLRKASYYWLYPVAALALIPHSLVEQRYFFEFLVLFILFRKPETEKLDFITLAIYVPVTLYLCLGIGRIQFFL